MQRIFRLSAGRTATAVVALVAGMLAFDAGGAQAQTATDARIRALQDQINALQRAVDELKASQADAAAQARAAQEQAREAQARAAQAQSRVAEEIPPRPPVTASGTPYPREGKPPGIHFDILGQDFQVYGRLHLSGIGFNIGGVKGGFMVESNQSVLGFRTARLINDDLSFIAQVEGEVSIANSPTLKDTFGYRDSFAGFHSNTWGTIAGGKHNTPYKVAEIALDPLYNTLGDIRSLFGNTGGDNRVEFSLRAPHAIWYISPEVKTGFGTVGGSALFSPGQNISTVNQDFAFGENICAGATPGPAGPFSSGTGQPGSGGTGSGRGDCNDGGFGDLFSAEVHWKDAGWLASVAYELHSGVNRLGDELSDVTGTLPPAGAVGVHDEWGVQAFLGRDWGNGFKTVVGMDSVNRNDAAKEFNERTKMDYVAMVSWQFTEKDRIGANYVHATNSPGDPAFFPNNRNHADMFALGYFHNLLPQLQIFSVAGVTINGQTAHYDLGAGGVAQPLLARKADNFVFTGKTLYGLQLGLDYSF